jgi:hypothetical protein
MTTQKKIDIVEELFFDDIFDIWEYISELKAYNPNILFHAQFMDYYQFVLSQLTRSSDTVGTGAICISDYAIYDRFYQITKKLIKDINKQFSQENNLVLSKDTFYNWVSSYNYYV